MESKICKWCGADLDYENGKWICNNCKQPQEIVISENKHMDYIG